MADEIFKKLEEQLKRIAEEMPEVLKQDLKKKKHYRTGALDASIDLLSYSMKNEAGKIQISMEALYYIQYLEKRNYLPKFLEKQKERIKEKILDPIKKDIIKDIKDRYKI